jgi:hypothetical protein
MLFTVDSIEGNSNIGVPMFSSSGKQSNYNYKVFTTPIIKEDTAAEGGEGDKTVKKGMDQIDPKGKYKIKAAEKEGDVTSLTKFIFRPQTSQPRLKTKSKLLLFWTSLSANQRKTKPG